MSKDNQANKIAQEMFGIFNKPAEETNFKTEIAGGGQFFNPNSKKAPDQTWRGIIRFLPNLNDMNNMTVEKISYWVPEGSKGFRFDSPLSLGKGNFCPVADTYWALKNSDDPRNKKLANKIGYNRNTFALIQILKDAQDPENDGKIMVWDLPYAIQNKIKAQMYPTKADIEMGETSNNVFDPINGFPMILKIPIKKTSEGEFRDYEPCKFNDKAVTMHIDGELIKMSEDAEEAQKQQAKMLETILAGPNLNDFAYKEPKEETLKRVKNALSVLTNSDVEVDNTNSTTDTKSESKPEDNQKKAPSDEKPETKSESKDEKSSENSEKPADEQKPDGNQKKSSKLDDSDEDFLKKLGM